MIQSYIPTVARSTPEDRLDRVLAAATRVFAEKGYKRTQMSDVAAVLGVSAGNLYNYVESKDALFHACLVRASPAEPGTMDAALPISTPSPDATRKVIRGGMAAIRRGSALSAALAVDAPDDVEAELAAIVGDLYDRTRGSSRFQALVERSALDLPELFEAFFVKMRRPYLDNLTTYLERRIASGHLRPVPHVATTARLINETQAWFARHRRGDQDAIDVDEGVARETVIDVLVAGLVARAR
jgi:AcrR family transcriptional regulator